MTMFDSRERAFEAKFAHDEEFQFLVTARRDKLLARQIAAELNLSGSAGDDLTACILALPDGPGHDALLLDLTAGTFLDNGIVVEPADAAGWLKSCAVLATKQLQAGQPAG